MRGYVVSSLALHRAVAAAALVEDAGDGRREGCAQELILAALSRRTERRTDLHALHAGRQRRESRVLGAQLDALQCLALLLDPRDRTDVESTRGGGAYHNTQKSVKGR